MADQLAVGNPTANYVNEGLLPRVRLSWMRRLRGFTLFTLGAWAGMIGAAAFVRRAVPSRGDEESDELGLVAVFDGIDLKSQAKALTDWRSRAVLQLAARESSFSSQHALNHQ